VPNTIYDIAKAAGVSIATVSRVFNKKGRVKEATRQKVLRVADELGYHPQVFAQGLARKKKNSIMMFVPIMSNHFFMEVLSSIQDKLTDRNFELNIVHITPDEDVFSQVEFQLKRQWADGYFSFPSILTAPNGRYLKSLMSLFPSSMIPIQGLTLYQLTMWKAHILPLNTL